ncbi:MAG: hypothetical protein ACU83N_12895 [Gammaproteobacteria bacterium]
MLIDTLPVVFAHSQLIGPFELLIVGCGLLGIFYISSPFPRDDLKGTDWTGGSFYQYLQGSWYGEWNLAVIFWPFFLIMNGALIGVDYLAQSGIISVSSWGNVHIMLAAPVIWWTVAVWRGSDRTGSRGWSACARLAVAVAYFEFGLRLYIRHAYPRQFFMCEELLLDYFSCF